MDLVRLNAPSTAFSVPVRDLRHRCDAGGQEDAPMQGGTGAEAGGKGVT